MRKYVITLIISMIIIILIYSYNKFIFVGSKDVIIDHNNVKIEYDPFSSVIKKDELNKILKNSYYEGNNLDTFSSLSINKNSPDLYYTYWALKTLNELGYETNKLVNNKDKLLPLFNKFDNRLSNLENIEMLSYINKDLKVSNNFDYQNLLFNLYDPNEHLFYFDNINESMEEKIAATSVAINIITNLEIKDLRIQEMKNKLLEMMLDDRYFTSNSIYENIINNGGLIINSLHKLGYTSTVLDGETLVKRKAWLKHWNENSNELDTEWSDLAVLIELNNINDFFVSDYKRSNKENLEQFVRKHPDFYGIGTNEQYFTIQPPYVFQLILLSKKASSEFPYNQKTLDFYKGFISSNFTKYHSPEINLNEVYYGLKLSRSSNFAFDSRKLQNLLKDQSILVFRNILNNNDTDHLGNIYFLIKSFDEIGLKFTDSEISSIESYLNRIDFSNVNKESAESYVSNLNYTLRISSIFGFKQKESLITATSEIFNLLNEDQKRELSNQLYYISCYLKLQDADYYFSLSEEKFRTDMGTNNTTTTSLLLGATTILDKRELANNEKLALREYLIRNSTNFTSSVEPNKLTLRILYEAMILDTYSK
ncbi:hypothetical protein [Paenibacillus sp. FSL R5-0519]|uniref:hypothetical protein n=1 Tax=Paenibacillus sp. FSL R5-0519 TaxID=2921648 RepID=UPI0030DC65CA